MAILLIRGFCRSSPFRIRAISKGRQSRPGSEVVVLDDEQVLQDVGLYRYQHPLENAALYKDRLSELSARIAELVKTRNAIEASSMFTFDDSLAKGQKMAS